MEEDLYIVTKNNRFYPDVEYFKTIEEAIVQRDKWIADMEEEENGKYECKVTVARILETTMTKTSY